MVLQKKQPRKCISAAKVCEKGHLINTEVTVGFISDQMEPIFILYIWTYCHFKDTHLSIQLYPLKGGKRLTQREMSLIEEKKRCRSKHYLMEVKSSCSCYKDGASKSYYKYFRPEMSSVLE